jgi:hypothetical protein
MLESVSAGKNACPTNQENAPRRSGISNDVGLEVRADGDIIGSGMVGRGRVIREMTKTKTSVWMGHAGQCARGQNESGPDFAFSAAGSGNVAFE